MGTKTPYDPKGSTKSRLSKNRSRLRRAMKKRCGRNPTMGEKFVRGFGRMKDRAALMTGGDSGIGKAIAIAYAREGADVAIAVPSRRGRRRARHRAMGQRCGVRKSLELPGRHHNESHCREIVERTVREFGRLDILVNNAAYQMNPELRSSVRRKWDHTVQDEYLRDVPSLEVGRSSYEARQRHHQFGIGAGLSADGPTTGLRDHQRRHCDLYQGAR